MSSTTFRKTLSTLTLAATLLSHPLGLAAESLETALAEYGSVPRERILDGVVQAVHHSTLSSQVNARVEKVLFDVDDHVQEGELILQFDDTEIRARLRQAEADQRAAKANLEAARSHFTRIEKLFKSNTASKSAFDEADAARDAARARVSAADAVLDQATRQLSYTKVIAPYSGIVTERHIELGETAAPGTHLMSGFSLHQLRVEVNFPQRLLSAMEQYQSAQVIMPDLTGSRVAATGITVFPFATAGASTIPVRVSLPENTSGIYPGMLVKVAFSTGNRIRLSIPHAAVVYRSEVVGVYVITEGNRVSFRHIRVGDEADDGSIEVLAGLDEGERVAVNPAAATALSLSARGN